MHTLVQLISIMMLLQKSIIYADTRAVYLGVHQAYGALKDTLKDSQISGNTSGVSGCDPFGVWSLHYQHSKAWGVTTTLSSFSPFESECLSYSAGMGNVIAKKSYSRKAITNYIFRLAFGEVFLRLYP